MSRSPSLGAVFGPSGVRFRVWAPTATHVQVVPDGSSPPFSLAKGADGYFTGDSTALSTGDRYRYLVDGRGPFPDPASRFQPEGVHGPSQVVDPSRFTWTDASWPGITPADLVIYELHVGTFTAEGTFASASALLPDLAALGVTAIELMPVADFPGARGWGYDGVDLFAPARCYGSPDELRRLVNEAHRHGLAVLLDVVYNHLGPDGNYLAQFSPFYFSPTHRSPWGPAINLDGEQSGPVREFLIENALCWVHEYHLDGLRLDATHHLFDDGPRHILAELSARVRASVPDRPIHLIAEDPRNRTALLRGDDEGGYGLDAIWSDDFHHELRRYLTGDDEGVFRDFRGSLADLATTINDGWLYRGAYSIHRQYQRGTDPAGISPRQAVFTLQNHDRIGNRALGERLNHQVDLAAYRAASALLLFLPATPLLFMGQEWAACAPFLFFTDHEEELGRKIKEGRRHEFRQYAAFADPDRHEWVPDIQAESTFLACKLDHRERDREPRASTLRLYRALLGLRRSEPALRLNRPRAHRAVALATDTLLVLRHADDGTALALVVHLKGAGRVEIGRSLTTEDTEITEGEMPRNPPEFDSVVSVSSVVNPLPPRWEVVLTTEDPPFAPDASPPVVERDTSAVRFARPSAVLLRAVPSERIAADPGDQPERPRDGT